MLAAGTGGHCCCCDTGVTFTAPLLPLLHDPDRVNNLPGFTTNNTDNRLQPANFVKSTLLRLSTDTADTLDILTKLQGHPANCKIV